MEEEQESSLPFLDVLVLRHTTTLSAHRSTENLHTRIDTYILIHTTQNIKNSQLPKHYMTELRHTTPTQLMHNKKPPMFVLFFSLMDFLFVFLFLFPRPNTTSQTNDLQHFTTIPYIQGTLEKIRRILNEAGLKVSFTPVKTIGNFLTVPKDPIQEHEKSQLVSKIPCADCEFVYIGQTKRDLKSRIAEHKRTVKNHEPEKSALCKHLMLFDHCINWNQAVVLKYVDRFYRRLTSESWYIHAHPYVINRSDGEALPAVYRSLAKSYRTFTYLILSVFQF